MNTDYNIENLDIVIYGGGNIGTQFACKLASLGYGVTVFTRNADQFSDTLQIIDEHDRITEGRIKKATDNIAEALSRDTIKEKVTDKDDSLGKNMLNTYLLGANIYSNLIDIDYMTPLTAKNKARKVEREY